MELGLGTVQFGLDYGISNTSGKVSLEEVTRILKKAHDCGIRVIDTAAAYGKSERIIGKALPAKNSFRIVTKLPALKKEYISQKDIAFLRRSLDESIESLGPEKLTAILTHFPGDLLVPGGEKIYNYLLSLKNEGLAEKIGISVYTGKEIDRLFHHYDFDIVQLPLNVLDQRLIKSGHVSNLKRKGVELHVRSAFLQGLLLMPMEKVNPFFSPVMDTLERYYNFLAANNLTNVEGALCFLRSQREIDVVLTGVAGLKELGENINAFNREIPESLDYSEFAVERENIINPQHWKFS